MIRLTRSQVQPIGVDIGSDGVKMLQVEVIDQSLSVVAAARAPLPDEARRDPALRLPMAVDLVRQMLRGNAFVGRRVVVCLPREIVQVKNVRLPVMPPAEVQSALEFEARNLLPFEGQPASIQYLSAGEVRQGAEARQELIVLGVKHADVDDFVEQLHRSRVVLQSIDFEPCALYRSVERFIRRREDEHEVHALVDVGLRRSQVVIGRGHDISFYKPIDIGAGQFHDAVARKLGIEVSEARALRRRLLETPAEGDGRDPVRQAVFDATRSTMEELAREVALCLRYYSVTFRGHRPARVRLLGGEAGDPQLIGVLAQALPVPVEPGRPLHSVNTAAMKPSDRRGYMGEWAVALGLSLKMTEGRFGARDGKARDPLAPREDLATFPLKSDAEVVDIERAVQGVAPTARPGLAARPTPALRGTPADSGATAQRPAERTTGEVTHA